MFFNKSKYSVTKLSDQVEFKPNVAFNLPLIIMDAISFEEPTSVTASLIKSSGRDIITLPTVVTVTGSKYNYTASGTVASTDWDGIVPISMKLLIDGTLTVFIQLKV